tara:strand:+ start:6399 stop:7724 length:1326 start_codon:yes stop_codon:yes gene_type:complete
MKIALISPRGPLYKHKKGIWKKSLRYAPLTLTSLASLVPKEINAKVEIYDEGIEDIPYNLDADLIGISAITGTSSRAYKLANYFRNKGITVVLGGVHPTLVPEEAAKYADSVVVGYAEQTWPQLLRDFKQGTLQKMYKEKNINLSDLPLPRRDMLRPRDYLTINTLEATRGCVHRCDFCVVNAAWGSKPFQKPISDVVKEIESIIEISNKRKLIFLDLNLIADKKYAKELFSALISLNVRWFGLSTVMIAWDDELLDLASKSGCNGLLIGFESLSEETLAKTSKKFNSLKDYYKIVDKLHEKGIAIMGCFVFGLDGDNKSVFKRTVDFCIKAKIDLPRFSICTPYPSTSLFNRLKEEGRILTEDWSLYDGQHVVFEPKNMTREDLYKGTEWAWKEVYSGKSMFKRLIGSRLHLQHMIPANLGYRFYAHNLNKFYTCEVPNL